MRSPYAVILAAGIGSRLGNPYPKPLTPIGKNETILSRQLRIFRNFGLSIVVVVGFKKDLIMEADPNVLFVYNPNFDTTNTSKSLLSGLRHIDNQDVLWINGDVVCDPAIIGQMLHQKGSLVAVNNAAVGEEEVKYKTDESGYISAISKSVNQPIGEALGINLIEASHLERFKSALDNVKNEDYFERGMERLMQDAGPIFKPFNVGNKACVEVDFKEDLEQARLIISEGAAARGANRAERY